MSPCGSYTHGETVFEEFTTVDQCTRNIAGHLQMLHLRESTELKSESDLILMRAGKSIFIITLFEKGGGSTAALLAYIGKENVGFAKFHMRSQVIKKGGQRVIEQSVLRLPGKYFYRPPALFQLVQVRCHLFCLLY